MADNFKNRKNTKKKPSGINAFFDKLLGKGSSSRSQKKRPSSSHHKSSDKVYHPKDIEDTNSDNKKDTVELLPEKKEYQRIWGIKKKKSFIQKLSEFFKSKKKKKKEAGKKHKVVSGSKKPVNDFFDRLLKRPPKKSRVKTIRKKKDDIAATPSFLKEFEKSRKKSKRKKSFFSKRKKKRDKAKIGFFKRIFKPKIKDPFMKQEKKPGLFKEIVKNNRNLNYFLNSLILFLTAYILVYLLYQFTVMLSASLWKLDSVLLYWDLAFNDYSPKWSRWNIIAITLSGPFICLVVGLLFWKFFFFKVENKPFRKLFFLWIGFHALNRFFGAFIGGVITDEGFGYVVNWLYLSQFIKILFTLITLFVLGVIGYFSTARFYDTAESFNRIRKSNKKAFLMSQAVLPSVIGGLLLILIKIPYNPPYETIMIGTMIFLTIPSFFNRKAKPSPSNYMPDHRKIKRISWVYILVFVLLMGFYRGVLDGGLHFNIQIKMDVTPARGFRF